MFKDSGNIVSLFPLQKCSYLLRVVLWACLLLVANQSKAQQKSSINKQAALIKYTNQGGADLFGTKCSFIKNIGQYDTLVKGYENMGAVRYGYEGFDMPVLFTPKGIIHLQQKIEGPSEEERERMERRGKKPEGEQRKVIGRTIIMEWLNTNLNPEIIAVDLAEGYHTYGKLEGKAKAYKKITYKELYPGIDLVFSFTQNQKAGFEYSLLIKPGADISAVKMRYGGDVKTIQRVNDGTLTIKSDIGGIVETIPVSFYGYNINAKNVSPKIKSDFIVTGKEISFSLPEGYDKTKAIVIDPFVTGTGNLTGINAGKAKDVDFDYAGNVYVTGGGDGNTYKLSKFDAAGNLIWTFTGTTILPAWAFGPYYGGFVVEKSTGNVYLGQGFAPATGYRIVRINTTGLYDNYISAGNPGFNEAWKLYWNCNSGSPQILIVGGGTSSTLNMGILIPPATVVTPLNITGATGICCQDMVDMVFDVTNNDIYSVFASLGGTPSVNNRMYKHTAPYSAATIAWNRLSGYTSLSEAFNRPYMVAPGGGGGLMDNSANILSLNAFYLYYWDGKNLKAYNKATGSDAGTPLVTANTAMAQGGIIADACNNIFAGDGNGVIKVYNFNGSVFSDAPPDIAIPGFAGKAVYDLAYDESKKLIYASGDGFVASFDVSAYCATTQYTLNIVPDCLTSSATATLTPAPPSGSTITYTLYIGATQIATNTTGVFTGLNPNITYTITAIINQSCSGTQVSAAFILPGATIAVTATTATCGNNTGAITAVGSGTTGPYTYSIDGTNFFPGGVFAGLAAGVYTVTVKDANGCKSTKVVTILNTNGPAVTFTQTNADCGNNSGTVTSTVTGGTPPYQYSINGGITYQNGNFFTGLLAGTYTLMVKDAAGCTNAAVIIVTSTPKPLLTAVPASATCGNNNGTITAFGSGGTAPLQYSINGNTFQASNNFTGLGPGTYTVTVKDINGCTNTVTVIVANFPAPTVTAVSTQAACNNINGTLTATGNGGLAPLQYSINGVTFQTSNIFTGLAAGTYTVTVKDATGCTGIVTVTIASIGGPSVTATSTVAACTINNGSITATASGGTPGYQYSLNNITYQVSGVFAGLGAGTYVVYVKDANGCISTVTIIVGTTAGPSITAVATSTSCSANTGTITATGTGGLAPLQYSIDGITYGAANTFSTLAAGIYTIYVRDANGCIKTTIVSVANASNLTLTVSVISSSCGLNNGTITAVASGGVGGLQYSINGTVYQVSNIFTGLAGGAYTVYVKDGNNCIVTKNVVVANASTLTLSLSVPQQATCGSASGVIVATATGGVAPLTYNIDGGTFVSTNIFVNVAIGVHTIIVKDASGCTATQTITITNSGAGTVPTDVTFVVNGVLACTGEGRIKNIKGVPGGGGNNYTFSLDGGAFTTANQFRPVSPGVHVITAKNQFGCTVSRIAIVGVGTPATATATTTPATCGNADGTITLVGVGANVPYHASLDGGAYIDFFPPGANSLTFPGLSPGPHTITMADDADFTSSGNPGACLTTITVIVPAGDGPSVTTTVINGTCGASTGSITAVGTGGTPPYQYNINGGAFFTSGVFNNLPPGVYAIGVKDNSGSSCIGGATVTLINQATPTVTALAQSTSCNLNNGSVAVTVNGGAAPYQYSIDAFNFQAGNIITGLAPGNYTVYVKDFNNCFGSVPVTINNTPLPKATAFTIAASCNSNDGSIVVTGSLGEVPYTFSIDGTVYQSSGIFTNLAAGFYTVYIKDARGCITTTGVSVDNTSGLSIISTATVSAKCGIATGSITVTASGGVAPLAYSNGGSFQASNVFSNLLPGNYTITVRDANGCLITKPIVVGDILGPQTLFATIVNAACGQNNGTITATASGGTAPLQYSIDGVTYQGNIFTNVPAGIYTLYVRDVNLCIKTIPVTVANLPGPLLTATSSPSSCGSSDGTITALATGGTLALTYSKDGITFQTSNIFLGLAAGPYTITVKDARGCTNTFNITVAIIGSPVTPTFSPVAAICSGAALTALPTTSLNGITGTWAPALNNTATTTYTFTPTAGLCATTATLTITVTPNIAPTFTPVAAICSGAALTALPTTSLNGITGTWAPALNNTATTTYTFTPTAGLCATTATLTITVNPKPVPLLIYHN